MFLSYWYPVPYQRGYYMPEESCMNGYNSETDKYCDYFDLGDEAPDFTLDAIVKGERTKVSLSDYRGRWVVLFFYGSDFTFV